jgi:hypothetical protein
MSICFKQQSLESSETLMDTATYASVAALYWTVAHEREHIAIPEKEFIPFDLSALRYSLWVGC